MTRKAHVDNGCVHPVRIMMLAHASLLMPVYQRTRS